jgi:hypothetical protein
MRQFCLDVTLTLARQVLGNQVIPGGIEKNRKPGIGRERTMQKQLGFAKRIRARVGLGTRAAWDCRPFGLGRVVAPRMEAFVQLAEGVHLHLASGELLADACSSRRSA